MPLTLDAEPARDLAARLHKGPGEGAANGVVDLSAYQRDGFLVYPDLLGGDEVEALRRETLRLSRGERGQVDGLAPAGPGVADEDVLRTLLVRPFPPQVVAADA